MRAVLDAWLAAVTLAECTPQLPPSAFLRKPPRRYLLRFQPSLKQGWARSRVSGRGSRPGPPERWLRRGASRSARAGRRMRGWRCALVGRRIGRRCCGSLLGERPSGLNGRSRCRARRGSAGSVLLVRATPVSTQTAGRHRLDGVGAPDGARPGLGQAEVANLAGPDELGDGAGDVLGGDVRVDPGEAGRSCRCASGWLATRGEPAAWRGPRRRPPRRGGRRGSPGQPARRGQVR